MGWVGWHSHQVHSAEPSTPTQGPLAMDQLSRLASSFPGLKGLFLEDESPWPDPCCRMRIHIMQLVLHFPKSDANEAELLRTAAFLNL